MKMLSLLRRASIGWWAFLVIVTTLTREVLGVNPIEISDVDTATFDPQFPGSSTIDITYTLDGATLGAQAADVNFYVLQSLGTYADCGVALGSNPPVTLDSVTEPTISGSTGTTTLVNTADWPSGGNQFCLRLSLMLKTDGTDYEWHQKDFKFTVGITYSNGNIDVIYDASGGVSKDLSFQGTDTQLEDTGYTGTGAAPTFSAEVTGDSFAYGDDIPITINFIHPLDIFDYTVAEESVIPVDGSNVQLKDLSNNNIALQSSTFAMTETVHANGIKGLLTLQLPLTVYQLTTLTTVRILIPVTWTNKARRRNLRALEADEEDDESPAAEGYTGPMSGIVNEVVEVQMKLFEKPQGFVVDESSGTNAGFTVGSVVVTSTLCLGAGAAIFL